MLQKIFANSRISALTVFSLVVIFFCVQILVCVLSYWYYKQEKNLADYLFHESVDDAVVMIRQQLVQQEQVLRGVVGLFDASSNVDREEFGAYIKSLNLQDRYPGLLAIGYAPIVEDRMPVTYIEPFNELNQKAVDFNLLSETNRRWTVEKAIATGKIAMTKIIQLKQYQGQRNGVLMVLPVYKKNLSLNSEAERMNAVEGVIYGAYHIDLLLMSSLTTATKIVDIHILDNKQMLLDTRPDKIAENESRYSQELTFPFGFQEWDIQVYSQQEFESQHRQWQVWVILLLGSLVNIFIQLIVFVMRNRQLQAEALAENRTEELSIIYNQLKINDERFRLALESSNMGTWNWLLDSNVIQWDEYVRKVFCINDDVPLSTYEDFLSLVHSDDRQRLFEEIAQAIENKTAFQSEYRIIDSNNIIRYISTRANILVVGNSKSCIMAGTLWDISLQKQHEKMKDEFVSVVSHELRTPLTAVSSVLSLLQNNQLGELSEKAKPLVEMAHKNSLRLKLLINDLLDMEKILAGKMHLDIQHHFVLPLVEKVVRENQPFADQYQIQVELINEIDSSTQLQVDALRLTQVLTNIISNAVKFSPTGNSVQVHIRRVDSRIRMSVTDHGIGIPADAQTHMFEKFYQVDSSSRRQKGGTGLGLAITKELVERMGGQIGFYSEEGKGSCFYVDF
jgi:signal transduction histidine kinase